MSGEDINSGEKACGRPNAKYELSKPGGAGGEVYGLNTAQETLNFHYSREHRLAKAPQAVQDLYKDQPKSRAGLFGVLVADRPRRMLFASIILLCAVIFVLSGLNFFDRKIILDGNMISAAGTSFEGTTIIDVRKTAQNTRAYTGPVNIAVFVQDPDQMDNGPFDFFAHRIDFTLEKEQVFRFAAPYDGEVLQIALQTEKDARVHFSFRPE